MAGRLDSFKFGDQRKPNFCSAPPPNLRGLVLGCIKADCCVQNLFTSRFLTPNTHFSAFFETYYLCVPLHRSNFKCSVNLLFRFLKLYLSFLDLLNFVPHSSLKLYFFAEVVLFSIQISWNLFYFADFPQKRLQSQICRNIIYVKLPEIQRKIEPCMLTPTKYPTFFGLRIWTYLKKTRNPLTRGVRKNISLEAGVSSSSAYFSQIYTIVCWSRLLRK